MKRLFAFILLIIPATVFLFGGCGDNGTDPDPERATLWVISDPGGASIYIDGNLEDGTTPSSYELDGGSYVVKVGKSGYTVDPESSVVELAW